jgi:hypothetical protein
MGIVGISELNWAVIEITNINEDRRNHDINEVLVINHLNYKRGAWVRNTPIYIHIWTYHLRLPKRRYFAHQSSCVIAFNHDLY